MQLYIHLCSTRYKQRCFSPLGWPWLFALNIINTKVEGKEEDSEVENWEERTGSVDISDEALERTESGAYERHQLERRRLQAKQQHSERRKAWLRKSQALLRVFLSYCSLHGAKGGGLTSVRMELLFLLQESQQVWYRPSWDGIWETCWWFTKQLLKLSMGEKYN